MFTSLRSGLLAAASLCGSIFSVQAQSWQATSAPQASWVRVASSADGSRLVAVADDRKGIHTSTNAGASWTTVAGGTYGTDGCDVAVSADGMKWIVAGWGDAGTWIFNQWGARSTFLWRPISSFVASSADGSRLVARSGGIELSTDFGVTWRLSFDSRTNNNGMLHPTWLASSADGVTLLAATTSNYVYISTNAGLTWAASVVDSAWAGRCNSVACSAEGKRLLAGSDDGVFVSTDAGATWNRLSAAAGVQSVCCSADGRHIAAGTSTGEILISTNSGTTWTHATPAGTNANFVSVACSADGSKFVAAAQDGQIYTTRIVLGDPMLNLALSGGSVVLSWPYPSEGFVLQETTDLASNRWSEVPVPPVLNGTNLQFQVTVPELTVAGFYRLFRYQAFNGTFTNLSFESPTLIPVTNPPVPWDPQRTILFSAAFPGWTGYYGTNMATLALSNTIFLDSPGIGLYGRGTNSVWWTGSAGSYFASVQAGLLWQDGTFTRVDTSLSQTGRVHENAKYLQFNARGQAFVVTLDGEPLVLVPSVVQPEFTTYRADVSRFSGRTVELRFTVLAGPLPGPASRYIEYLDSIVFSPW